jgi:predicted lipid-binding transport protein (Tim44 family)
MSDPNTETKKPEAEAAPEKRAEEIVEEEGLSSEGLGALVLGLLTGLVVGILISRPVPKS